MCMCACVCLHLHVCVCVLCVCVWYCDKFSVSLACLPPLLSGSFDKFFIRCVKGSKIPLNSSES